MSSLPWENDQIVGDAPAPTATGAATLPWEKDQIVGQNGQPQMSGPGRLPAMIGSNLAQGAAQGVGVIGDLQDLIQRGVNAPADWLAGLVGLKPSQKAVTPPWETVPSQPSGEMRNNPLNSNSLVGAGRAAGIMDRSDLQPQNTGERFTAQGVQGVGSMLPYALMGGGGLFADLARGTVQGGASGIGGELAAEAFPNYPAAARLGGQLAGAAAGGGVFNAANRLAGAVGGASSPALDAYRNLGIEPRLAGDVTSSPTMQMLQTYAAKAPGGANRIHSASEDAIKQWGDALDRTAADFGNSSTLQEAGQSLQDRSRTWLKDWRAAQSQAEAQVSAKVPANAPVDVSPVNSLLQRTSTTMPGLPSVADIMTNPTFKSLSTALSKDASGGVAPWSDIRAWRSRVGEELQKSLLSRDGDQEAWRQLYGSLSGVLGDTANKMGAGAEWTNANAVSANGHDFVENMLGNFINSRFPSRNTIVPADAATAALSGASKGGTALDALRQQMPEAADELAAYKLRDMGLANAGKQDASGARVSPSTFLTDSNKLSPEAAAALFQNDPRLRDLATVADGMKKTEQFLNTSNTSTHASTGHALSAFIMAPQAAIEGYHLGGFPGAATGLAASLVPSYIGPNFAARATTSPALTRLLAAPAAAPVSSGLQNRAAMLPPLLRLLAGAGGLQTPGQ